MCSRIGQFLFLSLIALSSAAGAEEFREFYTGVRELGMGGAYTAIVNDETAVLTNPAGLGKLRETTIVLADPEISGSLNDTKIAKLDNFGSVIDFSGLYNALKSNPNVHWNAKAQFFPSVVTTNFGLGLNAKYSYDAELNAAGDDMRIDYTRDYTAAMGYCFRFLGGILKVGVAARLIDRSEIHKDVNPTTATLTTDSLASEGIGLASDVGLILTAPVEYLPALAIVARDVGGTSYALSNGLFSTTSSRPANSQQTLDAGVAIFPITSNFTRMTLTADYHDITGVNADSDTMKRVHAGLEFNFHDFFFLRGGLNQRYWTSGIELASENFQLQAATYGEDIGPTGAPREDRRWVTKFEFRF